METVTRVEDVTTAKASSAGFEMPDSAICRLVEVGGDGDLIRSMGDEFMEVEEFLDDVHPVGDLVENVVSTPNILIPTNKIRNVNLVAVTGNEFMEVEDVLEHLHPDGESEKNVILAVNEETHNSKTDDGELVTAMNNELMEVEDFLKDVHTIEDSKENVVCAPTDDTSTSNLGNGELVPCSTDVEVEDFLNDVHPVREDEKTDICPSSIGIITSKGEDPVAVVEKGIAQQDAERSVEESNGQIEGIVSPSATKSNDSHINQAVYSGEYSKPVNEPIKRESSGPSGSTCTSSKPDFSKLKGKICLDSLSVRELQETFRAAFGRETSVKDKQWLRRRISMGLSNSCHVLSMTFIIDEGNTVKIVQEEGATAIEDTSSKDLRVGEMNENSGGLPMDVDKPSEDPENVSGERSIYPSAVNDGGGEDQQRSGVGNKRVRKPTKRYIEELSELESRENTGNLVSVSKNLHTRSASKPCVRPVCDARSSRRPLVTRYDSLGGSGVQIPYVCRIRRSRPRENYVAFMKLQPGSADVTTRLVKEALGSCGSLDDDRENTLLSAGSDSPWVLKPNMDEPEKERPCRERETCESEKDEENVEPSRGDLPTDNSDSDTPNVETGKGGVRRKHHRPWSLTEVVNLVEGVERFGAGRWSEIKRLSFASPSHRTSVDLKDKWRNLLRASFAQPAAEKGNFRKQVSAPIPPQIMVRIRQLAKMQAQVPPVLNSSKFNGGNVHATSPGYL